MTKQELEMISDGLLLLHRANWYSSDVNELTELRMKIEDMLENTSPDAREGV